MQVFLGDMELRPSEQPEHIQRGGGQHLGVLEFPGGNVAVQNFGSRYRQVSWRGWFEGPDAFKRMISIENMWQKGKPVVLKTERYSQRYIIAEFHPDYMRDTYIPFSIKLQPLINVAPTKVDPIDKIIEKMQREKAEDARNGSILDMGRVVAKAPQSNTSVLNPPSGGYSTGITPASQCTLPLRRWMRFQTILRGLTASLDYNAEEKKAIGSLTKADHTVTMTFRAGASGCVIKSDGHMYVSEAMFKNSFYNALNYLPTGSARLKNLEWFFIMPNNSNEYYHIGGNQSWMGPIIGNSGCGPTSAANIVFYLGRKRGVYLAKTTNVNDIPKQDYFEKHMWELNAEIAPVPFGASNIEEFAEAVVNYGKSHDLLFAAKYKTFVTGKTTLTEAVNFIKTALDYDYPLGLLTTTMSEIDSEQLTFKYPSQVDKSFNDGIYTQAYTYHWVTIIELLKAPKSTKDYTIRVLTWGTVADLKLSNYFDSSDTFKFQRNMSVVYFALI